MTFETVITLILVGGMGYMMFKGGGCCGPGGHKKGHEDGKDEKPEIGPVETTETKVDDL